MKLAKKHGHAVLAFEIALALGGGGGGGLSAFASGRRAQLAHDVLIDVLRPADMEKLKEPLCPEPDVRLLSVSCLNVLVCEERGEGLTSEVLRRSTSSSPLSKNYAQSPSTCVRSQT